MSLSHESVADATDMPGKLLAIPLRFIAASGCGPWRWCGRMWSGARSCDGPAAA